MRGSTHIDVFASSSDRAWGYLQLPRLAENFFALNPDVEPLRPLIDLACTGVYVERLAPPDKGAVLFNGNLNVLGLAEPQ